MMINRSDATNKGGSAIFQGEKTKTKRGGE